MPANRVTHAALLLSAAFALAACSLPGRAQEEPSPTPTLITPATVPPPDTPIPPPSNTPEPSPTLAPTEAPTQAPTQGPSTHGVEGGQWVYAIARIYGVSPQSIIDANPGIQSNPDLIFPNQQLVIPGQQGAGQAAASPTPTVTPVTPPTPGPASLPLVDRSVYEGMLTEALEPIDAASCSTSVDPLFDATWGLQNVSPRVGCPTNDAMTINGTWMEFGPGSRVIWLRELGEFHPITGFGFGQRWVFPDESGLEDAPPFVSPFGSSTGYSVTEGRMAWLLEAHPEITSIFSPAFGDENVIQGQYQEFENGAMLFDGALIFVFYEDLGPWWYVPILQPPASPTPVPTEETQEAPNGNGDGSGNDETD